MKRVEGCGMDAVGGRCWRRGWVRRVLRIKECRSGSLLGVQRT
ncbi:hypothetical protein E2C01_061535 [Portunus trituberculatus]|uniref:Uncharacterized protein n=1 Tax=Portunus trituberculatus TaxID=210409 RepID=A0A5B7H5H2_PORTR|nr:hypothetical protein [Portunus trituberculatus]